MGLEEYRKKRDFRRTPEPAGAVRKSTTGEPLEFVVQKHAATSLHYDFRLELEGTLKSWAVPKGPSLVPSTRRLAMHVEDHPLEYGSFEGVIPEGEYGGGTVLLWDRGTWLPEGDAAELYRKGRLKFTLEGEKLRGRWNLVRTRGREDAKESWLLIKDRDDESLSPGDRDITETRPESVVTGRTLEEIASDRDRVWHSNRKDGGRSTRKRGIARRLEEAAKRVEPASGAGVDASQIPGARKGPLPLELKAQLATLVTDVPPGDEWIHEIKFDGYRLLATLDKGRTKLVTRNGKDWTARFAGVAEALTALVCEQALLDGEAVVLDERGVSSFQGLQNAVGRTAAVDVFFYAFDLLYVDGWDLTRSPLLARKEALLQLVGNSGDGVIRYSDHVVGQGRAFYAQACKMGLEGVLSKRADRPHHGGRTNDWLKIKCLKRQEFVIAGFTEPSGSRQGFGALMLGVRDDAGQLVFAGKVGTGFSDRTLRELHGKLKALERKTPPVVNPPTGAEARGVHWVDPKLVAEVAFAEWTSDGRIRHPSFQGLREDKPASEVVREQPTPTRELSVTRPGVRTASKTGSRSGVRVAGIAITNADRVLYKENGVSKGDVAHYWEEVWSVAKPYLLDRPLTLVRCPGGAHEQCFYQKHWGKGMPEAVPRISIEESDGPELYMYIDDLPALISLVQFGVLEFHVWNAQRDRVDRPDQMMFDLDPDEDLPWPDVVLAAVTMREVLDGLGLQSFVKTTGGKGLHVVIPLHRRSTWDEVRQFTQGVAESFAKAEPARFTAIMSKRRRTGKVYIDYLRNAYNATAIAAYSTRRKEDATVSVPLTWDELAACEERPAFTVRNVPDRVRALKKDPWEGFSEVRQSITAKMLKAVQ